MIGTPRSTRPSPAPDPVETEAAEPHHVLDPSDQCFRQPVILRIAPTPLLVWTFRIGFHDNGDSIGIRQSAPACRGVLLGSVRLNFGQRAAQQYPHRVGSRS